MEMKRCPRKHFYDASKYESCPYCANNNEEIDKTVAVFPEDIEVLGDNTVSLGGIPDISFEDDISFGTDGEEGVTIPMEMDDIVHENEGLEIEEFGTENEDEFITESADLDDFNSDSTLSLDETLFQDPGYQEETNDEGKTVSIFGAKKVVGWLVCVKGSEKGKDFILESGRNFIGRSPSMDISLSDDATVSRENHAVIAYNPRGNSFSISYGSGHGIVYVNGQEVLNPVKLEAYDKIEVGETVLLFIPFCSEQFQWE